MTTPRQVERTEDGRYLVIDGRRWRATDPAIPETLRAELVKELMRARRMVKDQDPRARARVQAAKVALGERGEPWWSPTDEGRAARLEATILALLHQRDGSTICPSDAARVVAGSSWREAMEAAREVAWRLDAEGVVEVQQRGLRVPRDQARGPLRVARGPAFPGSDGAAASG